MTVFVRRNPALTHDEFLAHWRDVHGPLIRDTPEIARHLRRYEQHPALPGHGGFAAPDVDGIAIQWFGSLDDLWAMLAEPAYAEKVQPDEQHLLDLSRTEVVFSTETRVMIGEV